MPHAPPVGENELRGQAEQWVRQVSGQACASGTLAYALNMIVVPSRMGQINKRTLLGRLRKMGQGSRAELARLLGISQPTGGRIVDELLEAEVLEEIQENSPNLEGVRNNVKLGRPSRMLRLDSTHPRFLGIQLGVTETRLASLPLGIGNEESWDACFATPSTVEQWLNRLRETAPRFISKDLWGVLVSAPGIVDEKAGRILFSPNLHWSEKADLPGFIRQIWNVPVLLVQEERALSMGHAAVPGDENFLLVDFGEGVGGAVGCVETLISTRGLLQSFALAAPSSPHTWPALVQHIAQEGVTGWLGEAIGAVAAVIAGAVNVLGVGHVVITGSLTELASGVLEHLEQAVVKGTMWARFGKVTCVSAPRRRTAGLVCVGIDRLVSSLSDPTPVSHSVPSPQFHQRSLQVAAHSPTA